MNPYESDHNCDSGKPSAKKSHAAVRAFFALAVTLGVAVVGLLSYVGPVEVEPNLSMLQHKALIAADYLVLLSILAFGTGIVFWLMHRFQS